ncbi:MAG: T9SS type A sorting domain-containing protein [Bacteroidales bacterium]|nr:T9SS type A sorting domain-containing protein [Bacteroidales bacterium]
MEPYVIDTWIEGIGSRQGLFSDMIVLKYWRTGFYSSVRCYEYNNNLMIHRSGYIQGWQMDCDVPYSYAYYSLEEEIDKDISIYPNPVKDKLTIDSEKIFERVEIRNLYGQVVYAEQGTLKNIKINTAKMQSGIYMVRLSSEDSIFNKKIIIK